MMCVSRGKLSEGLNFSDELARACLIIGIPFLLVNDSKVNLKKHYLDSLHEAAVQEEDPQPVNNSFETQKITGDEWYKN